MAKIGAKKYNDLAAFAKFCGWELQPYQQRLVWALTHGEDYRRHWDLEGPQ